MYRWIRGITSSVIAILFILVTYLTWGSAGPIETLLALFCAGAAAFFILTLIYAIENDDSKTGAMLPFIFILGALAAYYGQVPSGMTLAMSLLSSILAFLLIQEGD